MTTPTTVEERVTILETRLDTILPTLATKEDIARLDGKIDAVEERLNDKIDAMDVRLNDKIDALSNRLLIRLASVGVAIAAIAVAAARYL